MKNFLASFVISLFCLSCVTAARAQSVVLIGTPASINGTSNSAPVNVGIVYYPRGTFTIQNAGLNATNDVQVIAQFSTDQTNYVTIASAYPTTTNAGTWTFSMGYGTITNFVRLQVVTTNAQTVSALYQP